MALFYVRFLIIITFSIVNFETFNKINGVDAQLLPRDCMSPFCLCLDTTTLFCSNFTSFKQLDFQRVSGIVFELVEIRPFNRRLDLNENLNFNGLKLNGRLTLSNLDSLSAFYNPFRQILYEQFSLSILNSNFRFVGSSIGNNEAENSILYYCNFLNSAQNFDFIFANLRIVEFTLSGIFFEQTMCPILFRNTRIFNLVIIDPFGAFGFRNLTTEISTNDVSAILNANIRQIEFDYSKSTNILQQQWLDTQSLINPILFNQLDRINLNSARRLQYIQEETFKQLKNVRKFEIKNVNIKDLLIRNRRWLKNLNFNTPIYDIDNLKLNTSMSANVFQLIIWIDNEWDFNDERDICLFRSFPHNKLVFPFLLFSQKTLPCTCTIYWLYKYFSKYQALYNLNQDIVPFHCFQQANWDSCRFDALFNKYCPNSEPDPIEYFTTLKPNTQILPNFETSTVFSTNPPTITTTTSSPGLTTTTTVRTPTPLITTTTTSTNLVSTAIPVSQDYIDWSMASYYMAVVLGVITFFMIVVLIILYVKTLSSKTLKMPVTPPSSQSSGSNIIKI